MLRGLTTVAYQTDDIEAAKKWYAEVLGVEPYFDRGAYAEFRIGDYQHELGLLDRKFLPDIGDAHDTSGAPGGAIVYWHVDDAEQAVARLVELGATLHQPPRDFGEGFIGASVVDPFGNILGVMHNPHYVEVLATRS